MGTAQAQQDPGNANQSAGQHATAQSGSEQGHMPLIMSPNEKLIEGQVINYKTVSMKNEKDHRVVELKERNGQMQEVDLGPSDKLPDGFDLRKGQWVLVAGVPGTLGTQPVFVAHRWANVFNLSATGGSPAGVPTENLPGQSGNKESSGQGGSNENYHAQYGGYPGHVGNTGPGANQNTNNK